MSDPTKQANSTTAIFVELAAHRNPGVSREWRWPWLRHLWEQVQRDQHQHVVRICCAQRDAMNAAIMRWWEARR